MGYILINVKYYNHLLLIFIFLFLLLPSWCSATEKIRFNKPQVYPATAENRDLIEGISVKAALLAERLYGDYLEVYSFKDNSQVRADFSLAINAVMDDAQEVIQVSLKAGNGEQEKSFAMVSGLNRDTPLFLSRVVFYLWSSFHDYLSEEKRKPADWVDELTTEAIKGTVIPEMPTMLIPLDIALRPNGNLLAAFSMICVEFDSQFRILSQPGRSLYESGNYTHAAGVAVTPAGTVFLKPSMGRELYRFAGDQTRPEKWRTGIDLYGPFASLPDGSVVVIDIQKRNALRIQGRKRKSLPLFTSRYSYISAISVGPEGNIWVFDVTEKRIRIHTPEGEILDSIVPLVDSSSGLSPVSLAVYKDGRFILYYSPGELYCFDRRGIPLWSISELPGLEGNEPLPQTAKLAVDSGTGLIFISDQMGQKIIKLLDRSFCDDLGLVNNREEKLIALNREQRRSRKAEPIAHKALLYEQAGALEMSRLLWNRVLDLDPMHDQAALKLDRLEIEVMTMNAGRLKEKAIEILKKVGPESARLQYSKTIQLYEQILALDPSNKGIAAEKKDLKERFRKHEGESHGLKPLSVVRITMDNLFPSLMQQYQDQPIGRVTIKNTLERDIHHLKASIYIKHFMDFPRISAEIGVLGAKQSVDLELFVLFNQEVLNLEEDLKVQAGIELSCLVDGQLQSLTESKALTLYRRTALQWDDSGKLSSFITPHETIVEQFSHRVSSLGVTENDYRLSRKFQRAARICDGLGTYGIEYIEDPDSPVSAIMGRTEVVDTVRFPRKTLFIHSGDCDDTTALLASLMESAGIQTAVMTSPGHVFMAFNTEEAAENSWMYNTAGLITISYKGTLWIPVETTTLNKGFMVSWQEASKEYSTYHGKGEIEFLPVAVQQQKYPPLPLPESIFTVIEPAAGEIDRLHRISFEAIEQSLYRDLLEELSGTAAVSKGRKAMAVKNRMGILHGRFDRFKQAEKLFRECNREDPEYLSAYINLANLYLMRKEAGRAIAVLEEASVYKPDSAALNLVLAQCYYQDSHYSRVRELYARVKEEAPALALRYSYLVEPDESRGSPIERAGRAQSEPRILWSVDP